MEQLWKNLIHALVIEQEGLKKLEENLRQQTEAILSKDQSQLVNALEEEKYILMENERIEALRSEILDTMVQTKTIPTLDVKLESLAVFAPTYLQDAIQTLYHNLKTIFLEINHLSQQNEYLMRDAYKLTDRFNFINDTYRENSPLLTKTA